MRKAWYSFLVMTALALVVGDVSAQDSSGPTGGRRVMVNGTAVAAPNFTNSDVEWTPSGSDISAKVTKIQNLCIGSSSSRPFLDKNCDGGAPDSGEDYLDATLASGADVYYVTNDGTATTVCGIADPCGDIQEGINQAAADWASRCDNAWAGCRQNVVYVGPGSYNENLTLKDGVVVTGAGWNSTFVNVVTTGECGVDYTDVNSAEVRDLTIRVWNPDTMCLCTRGGASGVNFTNLGLVSISKYKRGKGWASSIRGLANSTLLFRNMLTFDVSLTEGGAQFWWEIGKPDTTGQTYANIGRCRGGDPQNRGPCDNNNDCDTYGTSVDWGTCATRSADAPFERNFIQYEGAVGLFATEPMFCVGDDTKLGIACSGNSECGTGTCRRGYGTDFNTYSFLTVFQGLDAQGGLCKEGDSKEYSPCYSRCIGGSNEGARCNVLATCDKTCTYKVCDESGADSGTICTTNTDCDSNKCVPQACETVLNCIGGGSCSTVGTGSSACNQNHTWDCGTAGDSSCLAGGIWVASENNDGVGEDSLAWGSRNDVFGSSNEGSTNQAEFDVRVTGGDSDMRICGSSLRQGLLYESGAATGRVTEACYQPSSSIITSGSAPVTPIDGELYYKNSAESWCYWESHGTCTTGGAPCDNDAGCGANGPCIATGEICFPSVFAPTEVMAGGTGLSTIPDESILYCNSTSGGNCDVAGEDLTPVTLNTQSVLARQGGTMMSPTSASTNQILGRKNTANLAFMQIDPRQADAISKTSAAGATTKFVVEEGNTYGTAGCGEYDANGLLTKKSFGCTDGSTKQGNIQWKDEGTNKGTAGGVTSVNIVGPELALTESGGAATLTQKSCWTAHGTVRVYHDNIISAYGNFYISWDGGGQGTGGPDSNTAWFNHFWSTKNESAPMSYVPVPVNITLSNLRCNVSPEMRDGQTISVQFAKSDMSGCVGKEGANSSCDGNSNPWPCCTGSGTGTCVDDTSADGGTMTCWHNSTITTSTLTTLTGTTGTADWQLDATAYTLDVDAGKLAILQGSVSDNDLNFPQYVACSWKICER